MGNNLYAASKMQYYPTAPLETYRMLNYIEYMHILSYKERYIKENILGDELYRRLYADCLDNNTEFSYIFYNYCIEHGKYDWIKEYIEYSAFNTDQPNKEFTICDYFAGEGKWLELFKTFMKYESKPKIRLIANEIEENRYNAMKENSVIDEIHLGSFEELETPKRSASLVLFNPPYNDDTKQRNCKKYLQMILDRELIYKNTDQYHRETGGIIMVIREDDLLDSLELIVKNFDIRVMYKANQDEFSKWEQWIIIASLRYLPLEDKTSYGASSIQELLMNYRNIIADGKEFKIDRYINNYGLRLFPVDYEQLKDNFKYTKKDSTITLLSGKDNVLKWVKDITELKDMSLEKLVVPKPLKQGEIANLISSGYINGDVSLSNGTAKHIVIGGTKNMVKTEKHIEKGDDGEKYEVTEELRYTQPYLNILCNKDDKMQIIELAGAEN